MRGVIRNPEFAQTLRDFSGLLWGAITPTDIDAFVEFGDRIFIFIEAKHGASKMPHGQQLALERLSDVIAKSRHSLLIVCRHDCSPDEQIPIAQCVVTRYRTRGMWRIPKSGLTVREIVDAFKEKFNDIPLPGAA